MIEKSKQLFYENLNIQVKEGGVVAPETLKKGKLEAASKSKQVAPLKKPSKPSTAPS